MRRCRATGKPLGTLGATPDLARRYLAEGYAFVAVSSDLGFLTGQARATLAALRSAPADRAAAGGY